MESKKNYVSMKRFCRETGFPLKSMQRLVHSRLAGEFTFRTSGAVNAVIYIDVARFQKLLESGEVGEVLEA